MPEKLIIAATEWSHQLGSAILSALVGIAIGIGQLLASQELLTKRIIIGRALSTGGIAMAAGAVLVWVPDLPLIGLLGVAALLASLGTSGLERLFQRIIQGRSG